MAGYAPRDGIPMRDYEDFPPGSAFSLYEVREGIEMGIFPPGLIVWHPQGQPCVVVGQYGNQEFRPLLEAILEVRELLVNQVVIDRWKVVEDERAHGSL